MPWSEDAFKTRIAARAGELGLSLSALLGRAGLDPSALSRSPVQGRRLDTYLKLAEACDWSLAELLGEALDPDLLLTAFLTARQVLQQLDPAAQDDARLVRLQAQIYNLLAARRRRGEPIDAALLQAYAEILVATWVAED